MRDKLLVFLLFSTLVLFGCVNQTQTATTSTTAFATTTTSEGATTTAAQTSTSIEMRENIEVMHSWYSGMVDAYGKFWVRNNGSLFLEERRWFDANITTRESELPHNELQAFKKMVADANVFSFNDSYWCRQNCPMDLPSRLVTFRINGREKNVSMYFPQNMPQSLTQIIEKLNEFRIRFFSVTTTTLGFCGSSTYGRCSSNANCTTGGCSGQVCQSRTEESVVTTCEWRECFDETKYGLSCKCVSGGCKWS